MIAGLNPQILRELALDALTHQVVAALRAAGVTALLVKGPVTQQWLYDEQHEHPYSDVDLLISPRDAEAARSTMLALGFDDHHAGVLGIYHPTMERAWVSVHGLVDLHTGIVGIPASTQILAWQCFESGARNFDLRGQQVLVMDEPARTLHLALHAGQWNSGAKARKDLAAGLHRLPRTTWVAAAALAEQLDATPAFVAGLGCLAEGRQLLDALGVRRSVTVPSLMQERGAAPEALAIERLVTAKGQRWTVLRGWWRVEKPGVPLRRRWVMRLGSARRLPRGLRQWSSARRWVRKHPFGSSLR